MNIVNSITIFVHFMVMHIKVSSSNRDIYLYMKEDQHQKEAVQEVPNYDVALYFFEVLFGSRYCPSALQMLTL